MSDKAQSCVFIYTCALWTYLWVMCAVFWGLGKNLNDEADPATDYIR